MDKLEKIYNQLITTLGNVTPRPWQEKALKTKEIWNSIKVVIAAGTGSGKTFFTIMWLCMKYLLPENKNKLTLILPSAQTNLRKNFGDSLKKINNLTFTYFVATNRAELQEAIKGKYQVIIALPQSVNKLIDLPKVDTLILDEAHTWYFAKTVKEIIKKTKPSQRVLLTGSPSKFNLRGGFYMHYVPVMEVYDEGFIANTEVHVVSSSYNFKEEDYNFDHELTLKSRAKMQLASEESFKKVILGMIRKLKNPIKGLKNVNRLTNEIGGRFFNHLDKTLIWAADQKQANKFAEILRTFNGLENAVLVSHSKNDKYSEHLNEFKKNNSIRVLVCVDRTRLGWDFTELFNGIDFTMSRNLNTIQQMMARLFRISEQRPNDMKYFFKVANVKDAGYYTVIMKGVLLLLDREWMSKFNGKNFFGMEIPVTVPRRRVINPDGSKSPGRKKTNYKYEMLDIPLDLNFFRTVYAKQDDVFSTVAWTTISQVRKRLFGIQAIKSPEYAINTAKQYPTRNLFMKDNHMLGWYIQTNNLSDEAYSHMPDYVVEKNKDNKKFVTNWLKQYKGMVLNDVRSIKGDVYKADGRNLYNGSFFIKQAYKLGIDLDKIFKVRKSDKSKITKEQVVELAKQYESSSVFQKEQRRAYFHALRNGYAKELRQYYTGEGYIKKLLEVSTGEIGTYKHFTQKYNCSEGSIYNLTVKDRPAKTGNLKGLHFRKLSGDMKNN